MDLFLRGVNLANGLAVGGGRMDGTLLRAALSVAPV